MEWTAFPAGDFYFPYESRVVVALADRREPLGRPPPYEDEDRWFVNDAGAEVHCRRISFRRPVPPGGIPRMSPDGNTFRRFDPTFIPLFPTAAEDLPEVARAWTALLAAPESPGVREGHAFFLADQVADDYTTLPRLLENELALWEAIRLLRPGQDEQYQVARVAEALELGGAVIERFLGRANRSYGVAMNVLTDLVRRTMVTDKLWALRRFVPP